MPYDYLATYYSDIFPATGKLPLLLKTFKEGANLLDVGCADGAVAIALSAANRPTMGIDFSPTMVAKAQADWSDANGPYRDATIAQEKFQVMDMQHLNQHFSKQSFDGLFCIGNTLVHLDNEPSIQRVLRQCHQLLKPGSPLVLQILNYDLIIAQRPSNLSPIESDRFCFNRHYQYIYGAYGSSQSLRIQFKTELLDKASGQVQSDSSQLYPLKKTTLEGLAVMAGFKNLMWYSDFNGSPWDANALPLILVATA